MRSPIRGTFSALPVVGRSGDSEIITIAENQVITGDSDDVENTITSDPIPLQGRDRVGAILVIHYMYGGNGQEFSYYTQVSNDGTNWVDAGINYWTDVLPTIPDQRVDDVHGEWMRFVMWFKAKGSVAPAGAACLDLVARLDRK